MRGRWFIRIVLPVALVVGGPAVLPMEQPQAPGTPWGLIVAIDHVRGRELPVVDSMQHLAKTLRSRYGFRTIEIYGEEATQRAILQSLDKLALQLGRRDSLVVIFATPTMTDRGGTPSLLPAGGDRVFSKIRADELAASMQRIPGQTLVVFQDCQWLGVDLGRLTRDSFIQQTKGGYGGGEIGTFVICEGFEERPEGRGTALSRALERLADENREYGVKELAGMVSESAEVALFGPYFSFRPTSGVNAIFTRLDTAGDIEERKETIRALPAELKTFTGDRDAMRDQAVSRLTAIAGNDGEEVALRTEALSSLRKINAYDVDWLLGLARKSDAPRAIRIAAFTSLAADKSPAAHDGILRLIDVDLPEIRQEAYW